MQCLNSLTVLYDRLAEWSWQNRFAVCTPWLCKFDHLSQGILILKVLTKDEPFKGTTYRKDGKKIFIVKGYRKLFTETMELVLNRLFCFIIVSL